VKGIFVKICLIGFVLFGCASIPKRTIPSLPKDVTPGPNESEVLIQYSSSILHKAKGMLNVFLNGEMVAQVMPDSSERIIIPNDSHTIGVRQAGAEKIFCGNRLSLKYI